MNNMVQLNQRPGLLRPLTQSVALGLVFFCCSALATMASPAPVDSAMFDKWTADIEKVRKSIGVQGTSVVVVHKGKIIYAKGFGNRNDVDPFTPETLVPIASVTKGFTAAAIAELVSQKKASWDVLVSEYLPEFQLKDPRLTSELTFIDLLAHRTAVPPLDSEWHHRKEPRLELIKQMRHIDVRKPIRSEFLYNNAMYAVAGEAGARIANTSYEELVLKSVIRPLGMQKTGFSIKTMLTKHNHALPYTSKDFAAAQNGEIQRFDPDTSYLHEGPAGDIHSNVLELANWAKAIMHNGEVDGKQVLSKESVEQMTSAYMVLGRKPATRDFGIMTYGLGLRQVLYKGHQSVYHDGYILGYRSSIYTFPDDDLAIISLSNTNYNMLPRYLGYYIADDILNLAKTEDWLFDKTVATTKMAYMVNGAEDPADLEQAFPPQIRDKPPTRDVSDFVGEYSHSVAGVVSFQVVKAKKSGEKDMLAFDFRDHKGVANHYHFDSFRLRAINIDIYPFSVLASFVTGFNGMIDECHILIESGENVVYSRV